MTLMSKAGKEFTKRELTICDDSGYQVKCALLGDNAVAYPEGLSSPVIAVKDGKVGDYGGRTVSCAFSSSMAVDPDIPEAHGLKGWFIQQEQSGAPLDLKVYSGDIRGGKDPLKVISQITSEHLGAGEKVSPKRHNELAGLVHVLSDDRICTRREFCVPRVRDGGMSKKGGREWRFLAL
jgi:replication factor A1